MSNCVIVRSRFGLVFDREGYSPGFFKEMWEQRIACYTYRKYPQTLWPEDQFERCDVTFPDGQVVTMELAERGLFLGEKIWLREIRKRGADGHQTSLVTTDYESDMTRIAATMFSRWSQENFFKYMMQEFGIDTLVSYFKEKITDTTLLINPEYRTLENARKKMTSKLNRVKAKFATLTLQFESIDEKAMEKYISKKNELKEDIEQKDAEIEKIKLQKKSIPRKIIYSELPETEKFDNVINQRKHFLDTIKLIAYRAETALSNMAKEYMSHKDESRLLLKQIYKTDANLIVDSENQKLIVEIHRLAHWKDDIVLEKLCDAMNDTETKFPDSNLTLNYKLVSS